MKILVFSDSHGHCDFMLQAVALEKPDYVIHLGDFAADAESIKSEYPMLPVMVVKGNCDYGEVTVNDFGCAVYGGVRVMAVHGHNYGVKRDLFRLFLAAKEKAVHIALFGHTHCAYCEYKDGIWLLNPGSCNYAGRQSYGLITISNETAQCTVKTINEGECV